MALATLKSLLPSPLRRGIKSLLGIAPAIDPDWRILAPIGPVQKPHVVFDVGANKGYFLNSWRKWCPAAEFHAFDPTVEACEVLRTRFRQDSQVHIHQCGLGESAGELEFQYTSAAPTCSSFLAPDQKTFSEVQYKTGKIQRRKVPVTTLDAFCREHGVRTIYLMKIDVQGFELNVLKGGAAVALPITDYILVESGIRPFYHGAPRFTDVFEFLTANGFHLIGMRSYHRGNLTLMETDMLFRRDALMPTVDPGLKEDKIGVSVG